MASRYTNTLLSTEENTQKSFMRSTIYPKIKPNSRDFFIISDTSDRLDLLAQKYYGQTSMWWIIAVANNLNDGNFYVPPGRQLRIPTDTIRIMNEFNRINL